MGRSSLARKHNYQEDVNLNVIQIKINVIRRHLALCMVLALAGHSKRWDLRKLMNARLDNDGREEEEEEEEENSH